MRNPTPYLKMRVLGAIDMAEGKTIGGARAGASSSLVRRRFRKVSLLVEKGKHQSL